MMLARAERTKKPRGPELPFALLLGASGCGAGLFFLVFISYVVARSGAVTGLLPLVPTSTSLSLSLVGAILQRRPWLYAMAYLATWLWLIPLVRFIDLGFLINWIVPYVYGPAALGVRLWWTSWKRWLSPVG